MRRLTGSIRGPSGNRGGLADVQSGTDRIAARVWRSRRAAEAGRACTFRIRHRIERSQSCDLEPETEREPGTAGPAARRGGSPCLLWPPCSRSGSTAWGDEPAKSAKGGDAAPAADRPLSAKGAVTPAAPVLPAAIVTALQEGRFAEAEAALVKRAPTLTSPADGSYNALILGTAQRLGGKPEAARATFRAALDAAPKGPWAPKIRLELAGVELAAGLAAEAEPLARSEAERLLAGDRKDRLAEVYHAFARRLLKPDNPVTPADPNGNA